MKNKQAIVIGAGIVGLATARALANQGCSVTILERTSVAVGASIRNFGMVLPFAQPDGPLYQRAMRSREIWCAIGAAGAFDYDPCGSIYVAQQPEELKVLEELAAYYRESRGVEILSRSEAIARSPVLKPSSVLGALYSPDEVIIDPRQAVANLPRYLDENFGIQTLFNHPVQHASTHQVISGGRTFQADLVFICSGADFESLYPLAFQSLPITRCKLQMLRTEPQPAGWNMGPALCGGLSLLHYQSFQVAPSIQELRSYFERTMPDYLREGIHVMMTQHASGELTIGDSHSYGHTPDPFDHSYINQLILDYLSGFANFPASTISATWHGIYPKMTDGSTEVFLSPEPGVFIVNGVGGAGMTMSFGLAEELMSKL